LTGQPDVAFHTFNRIPTYPVEQTEMEWRALLLQRRTKENGPDNAGPLGLLEPA
jgi:hypothetical protein